jgi:hypothetical protein
VALGVAAVALVGYTGHQALSAKKNLEQVAADFNDLGGQLTSGQRAAARHTLVEAQGHARLAHDNTSGPGWWLTSRIPGLGANIDAVRTIADVTDTLSQTVLPEVLHATSILRPSQLRPVGGRVHLAPLVSAAPGVVQADLRLRRLSGRIQDVDPSGLAPQIAEPVRAMQRELTSASALSGRASTAVRLLPSMLGDQGPRTYLLMFQNNAELRSTGGIPGSFAVVRADHGRIAIDTGADASTPGTLDRPVLPLTAQERALFGSAMGTYYQDVNFTPDFPRSARLIQAMWHKHTGERVDGVISTDPVALSHVLRGTGPVTLEDGRRLTADNAAELLLSTVYADVPEPRQNAYFSAVAHQVFGAVTGGQGDPKAVLDALAQSASQRRILLWSDRPGEQALIAPTLLGGLLPVRESSTPDVGVYLNDGGGSKLDYYLRYAAVVTSERCEAGRQRLRVSVRLRSQVPRDPSRLPDYVAENATGIPRGVVRTSVLVYGPTGGYFEISDKDKASGGVQLLTHRGRPVAQTTLDLSPGGRRTLSFELVTGQHQLHRASLQVTPGVSDESAGTVGASACAS